MGARLFFVFASIALLGCTHAPEARRTGWYACGPAPTRGVSHCSYDRGHFLQLADDESGQRRVFVDGHQIAIRRMSGKFWSPSCAYRDFDTLQEAALCNVDMVTWADHR